MSTRIKKQALCLSAAMLLGAMTLSGCQMNELNDTLSSINDSINSTMSSLTVKSASNDSTATASAEVPPEKREYIKVSVNQICQDAKDNIYDAQEKYTGKWIKVTGKLLIGHSGVTVSSNETYMGHPKWTVMDAKGISTKGLKSGQQYTFDGRLNYLDTLPYCSFIVE